MYQTLRKTSYIFLLVFAIFLAAGCNVNQTSSGGSTTSDCSPPFTVPPVDASVDYLEFMALGDTGGGDEKQRSVARAMADYAQEHATEFVLLLGDNFYPDGVTSVDDPKFDTHFESIYDKNELNIPFYVVPGNHDYHADVQAQVDYSARSTRWHMPKRYFTFTIQRNGEDFVQFFALDTTPIAKWENEDEQLRRLEDELSRSQARWKIAYGHHPIYSNGKHGNCTRMMGWVYPLLEAYGVDVYLSGHDHDLQILKPLTATSLHFLVSGTGSSFRDTQCKNNTVYCASKLGFMGLRLSNHECVVSVVLKDGNIDYCHVVSK